MFNNYRVPNWHFHYVREIMKLPLINLENFILQKRFQIEDEKKVEDTTDDKNEETKEEISEASPEETSSSSESSSDEEEDEELSEEPLEPVFVPPEDLPGEKSMWTKTGDLLFIFKESSTIQLQFNEFRTEFRKCIQITINNITDWIWNI